MLQELYETIHFSSRLPVKVFLSQHGHISHHWHQSYELILVLEGEIDAVVDGVHTRLKPDDLLLINSSIVHTLDSPFAISIVLQFSPEAFNLTEEKENVLTFQLCSAGDDTPQRYQTIRAAIAMLVRSNATSSAGTPYINSAYFMYLIGELMNRFRVSPPEGESSKRKHAARMTEILDYINTHYAENFSLAELAEHQQLSVPYLSSFFNKQMGISFSQYYTDVKLEHAVYELTATDDSIETVAANNGFPEPHAFVRAFKKKYNQLPSTYRKQATQEMIVNGTTNQTNYLKLEPTNYLNLLDKFLIAPSAAPQMPTASTDWKTTPPVSFQASIKPLRHTFRSICTVGRASDLLHQNILSILDEVQHTIRFKYIRFHGLLGDDMMPVTRDREGKLHFNFMLIDQVLDNLHELNLKPWVELSFMPSCLASDPDKTIFQLPFNTSPPKDMEEWVSLVEALVKHLIARFGPDEVKTWPFSVWSEPDTPTSMFGWDDPDLFLEFYRRTRQTVKAVCPGISFGSPAVLYMRHNIAPVWIRNFLGFVVKNNCVPDFLSIHYYADMLPTADTSGRVELAPRSRFPSDPNDFRDFITDYQSIVQQAGMGQLPIYMTEWNLTFSHRNLINDTVFKSCYFVKNILENYDRLESFAYWSLTDLLSENALPETLFHGGMGMYTHNGIRKPVYHAMRLMQMLGDELIGQGEGYFVTRRDSTIRIMTYHYVHYGSLFAAGESYNISQTDRYGIFDMSRKMNIAIPLTDLPEKQYLLREYYVNQENGSAFDQWLKSGALPINSYEALVMNQVCSPGFHQAYVSPRNGTYIYAPTLEPLEIRFTTFTPM